MSIIMLVSATMTCKYIFQVVNSLSLLCSGVGIAEDELTMHWFIVGFRLQSREILNYEDGAVEIYNSFQVSFI